MSDETTTRATHGTLTAKQVMVIAENHQPEYCSNTHVCFDWQAVADELNAELGSDDEYEAKMDALLCRLTNGKWSKSRSYDLDFMVSCIEEEYEDVYEKERAELGSGTCEFVECGICKFYHADIQLCEYGIPPCSKFERRSCEPVGGTCEIESKIFIEGEYVPCPYYEYEMECGGQFRWDDPEPPKFCPNCGSKAVDA